MLNGWQKPASYIPGKGQDKCFLSPSSTTLTLTHYSSFCFNIEQIYKQLQLHELFLNVTNSAFKIYQ